MAVQFDGVNSVSLTKITVRKPEEGELLIASNFSCVSPGTEMRCLDGTQIQHPGFPILPGYSMSGRVIEVGPGVEMPLGSLVYALGTIDASISLLWGGHSGICLQKADSVIRVPEGVSALDASMTHLAAIALRGLEVAQPKPTDHVLIVGLGPIGQLSSRWFAATGAIVKAVDFCQDRVNIAIRGGIDASVLGAQDLDEWADIVVDATGVPVALAQSFRFAKAKPWGETDHRGAKIIIQGSYPDDFTASYDDCFRKELSLMFPRDSTPADLRNTLAQLANGKLKITDLVRVFAPNDCADAYRSLRSQNSNYVTAVFDWVA